MSDIVNSQNLESHLARFGLTSFRRGQEQVIQTVFAGEDCLCIMPTGGGKSLCYQFPSVVRDGTTLVISPLIALMKDQVDSLVKIGIKAACLNSAQTLDEQGTTLRELSSGQLDLLYVAPERLRSPRFVEAIESTQIQLLAIDEAHCISQWGHDFRPDYARLGKLRERIGSPQTIALTATATTDVQEDITRQLHLHSPKAFVTGFARDNLSLKVSRTKTIGEKNDQLVAFLNSHPGAGIIYASTRKKCEEIAALLSGKGRKFGFYHGGMMPVDREQIQNQFMDGEIDVIIATNAFGMGIDKSDIRFVIHYNIPGTLEAYYQEAGRAGRDGQPSECLLLFSNGDRFIQEFFIENAYPSRKTVEKVYEFLRTVKQDPIELTLLEIKESLGLEIASDGVGVCEQLLEKAGAIERLDATQNLASVRLSGDHESYVELLPREAKTRRRVMRKIESIVGSVRDDRVYFHPRELVDDKLGLESINRAIRQLNELKFFDYVPPFRGRAIHLTDPSRKFASWQLDFEEMNRRKELEYQKLQTVVDFANSNRCRQLEILEYFGDRDQRVCNSCDNCGGKSQQVGISTRYLAGVFQGVRIALSGVARSRGRFGRSLVTQMLWGSSSAKVRKSGLQRLSTFGLLSFLNQSEIETLIEALIAGNLVKQTEKTRFRPTIEISEVGKKVMLGNAPLPSNFEIQQALARKLALHFPDAEVTVAASQDEPAASHSGQENSSMTDDPLRDANSGGQANGGGEANSDVHAPSEFNGQGSHEADADDSPEISPDREPHLADSVSGTTSPVAAAAVDPPQSRTQSRTQSSTETPAMHSDLDDECESFWTIELLEQGYEVSDVLSIRRLSFTEFLSHLLEAIERELLCDPEVVFSEKECALLSDFESQSILPTWVPVEFAENTVEIFKKLKSLQ